MASNEQKLIESKKKLEDDVLKLINACLISFKGELSLDQLKNDYKKLSGNDFPLRQLGHPSLASFVQSYPNNFYVRNCKGNLVIKAKDAGSATHVAKLVSGQKYVSRKPKKQNKAKIQAVRQPKMNTTWTPPQNRYNKYVHQPPKNSHDRMVNNQMAARLYDPRTDATSKKFYMNGRWCIPRATHNTDKQYPPYFQVPPRFNNNLDARLGQGKPGGKTYKKILEEMVKEHGINDTIVSNTIPEDKKGKSWMCSIKFGEYKFICYPKTFPTPEEAEEATAKIALDKLKEKFSSKEAKSTTSFETSVTRVKELIQNEPSGYLWTYVKEEYEKKYKEVIPDDWPQQAKDKGIRGIVIETLFDGRCIMRLLPPLPQPFTIPPPAINPMILSPKLWEPPPLIPPVMPPVMPTVTPPAAYISPPISPRMNILSDMSQLSLNQNTIAQNTQSQNEYPPSLKLPENTYFNITVTVVKDCSDFCLRLLGDGYSLEFENLITDMELYYMEKSNCIQPTEIYCGQYYACNLEDTCFRVQVLNIDDSQKATVFFVDHGDEDEIDATNLMVLPKEKFLMLPFQHVRCSLAGLEFCKDSSITSDFQQLVMGKSLVAEVLSKDDKTLSVILYDTSTEEDVNINKQILDLVPKCFAEPQLPGAGDVVEVYYSYLSPTGDLYVSIETETYNSLMIMLDTAKKMLKTTDISIDMTKLYLAKFSQDGDWHRAVPRSEPKNGQAIKCHLHNVPPANYIWTPRTSERLMSLITIDQPLLLKVIVEGMNDEPPSVELFKRLQPQNELVSINQTLAIDMSLYMPEGKSMEDRNNNRECNSSNASFSSSGINSGPSSLSSLTMSPTPSLVLTDSSELPLPQIPKEGQYFDVYVTFAASPSNFAVQGRTNLLQFNQLSKQMNEFYDNKDNHASCQIKDGIREGLHYALKHTDGTWYRVRIDRAITGLVAGAFIDYGDQFGIDFDPQNIMELHVQFKNLPYQAIKGRLAGIQPINQDWTPENSLYFCNLIQNKHFVSIVRKIIPNQDKIPTLELTLIDTKDKDVDVFIHQVLIDEKIAKPF